MLLNPLLGAAAPLPQLAAECSSRPASCSRHTVTVAAFLLPSSLPQALPTTIGSNVTIGPGATIHAATIEDCVVVGMGATIMDGAKVGTWPVQFQCKRWGV